MLEVPSIYSGENKQVGWVKHWVCTSTYSKLEIKLVRFLCICKSTGDPGGNQKAIDMRHSNCPCKFWRCGIHETGTYRLQPRTASKIKDWIQLYVHVWTCIIIKIDSFASNYNALSNSRYIQVWNVVNVFHIQSLKIQIYIQK